MNNEKQYKYTARITRKAFKDFEFLGDVNANSTQVLKEKARSHARSWNKHGQRLYLDVENNTTGQMFEMIINS